MEVSSIGSVAAQRDAERLQERAECEMVVLVAREARQVEHDHEVGTALVQATEREQRPARDRSTSESENQGREGAPENATAHVRNAGSV